LANGLAKIFPAAFHSRMLGLFVMNRKPQNEEIGVTKLFFCNLDFSLSSTQLGRGGALP
jgi:hypothetical protein